MNTSRGEGSYFETRNGLRMYGPYLPRSITVDQLPQFINLPYAFRTGTPIGRLHLDDEERVEREASRRSARPSEMNSVSNDQSSKPSPDEIIIKGRGRRSLPVKWSPIPIESPQKTPLRSFVRRTPRKDLITLRSSPKKRLQLNDASNTDLVQSRKSLISSSPLARKSVEPVSESVPISLSEDLTNELSKSLIDILNSFNEGCPRIKDDDNDPPEKPASGTSNENVAMETDDPKPQK